MTPCPYCDQASVTVDGCCVHCGAPRPDPIAVSVLERLHQELVDNDRLSSSQVLAAVSFDEALTTAEVAQRACGVEAWRHRSNVRNRLRELEARGDVISDENRPVRWLRPIIDASSPD